MESQKTNDSRRFSRRRLLSGAVASGLAATIASSAQAYTDCGWDPRYGDICITGISSRDFRRVGSFQQTPVWCWAAVYEMIFRWHGVSITQAEIVEQTYGAAIPTVIDWFSLIRSANRFYYDSYGDRFQVSGRLFSADGGVIQLSNRDVVDELERQNPLVICNLSHMMVLIGVQYQPTWQPNINAAWVADPYPFNMWAPDMGRGFRDLPPNDFIPMPFGSLRYLATVRIS